MESSRAKGLQALAFGALAALILFQDDRLPGRHPQTLAIGLVMILLAAWEATKGTASLVFRRVAKSDNPRLFWLAVLLTALVGVWSVILGYF